MPKEKEKLILYITSKKIVTYTYYYNLPTVDSNCIESQVHIRQEYGCVVLNLLRFIRFAERNENFCGIDETIKINVQDGDRVNLLWIPSSIGLRTGAAAPTPRKKNVAFIPNKLISL